jgi:hypothetical protein
MSQNSTSFKQIKLLIDILLLLCKPSIGLESKRVQREVEVCITGLVCDPLPPPPQYIIQIFNFGGGKGEYAGQSAKIMASELKDQDT